MPGHSEFQVLTSEFKYIDVSGDTNRGKAQLIPNFIIIYLSFPFISPDSRPCPLDR